MASAYRLDYRQEALAYEGVKRVEWSSWRNHPYYRLTADSRTIYVDASDTTAVQPFCLTEERVRQKAHSLYADSIPYRVELLTEYDADYFGRKKERVPLPVYRVEVEDAVHTCHYYQHTTLMHRRVDDDARLRRLLYSGLHSLNFKYLTDRPELWNLVMYTLLETSLKPACGMS